VHGTNLTVYGDDSQLVGQLAPLFEILGRSVRQAASAGAAATADQERSA